MEGIMEFTTRGTHDIPTPPKITFDAPKQDFVAQEWHYVHLMGKKLDYVHLSTFSTMMQTVLGSNLCHHTNTKSLMLTIPQNILVIEVGW